MSAMNRREMLKITPLALQAQGFQVLHANGLGLREMVGQGSARQSFADTYEWQDGAWIALTVPRLLVCEAIRVDLA